MKLALLSSSDQVWVDILQLGIDFGLNSIDSGSKIHLIIGDLRIDCWLFGGDETADRVGEALDPAAFFRFLEIKLLGLTVQFNLAFQILDHRLVVETKRLVLVFQPGDFCLENSIFPNRFGV